MLNLTKTILSLALMITASVVCAQNIRIQGQVTSNKRPVSGVNIILTDEGNGSIGTTDESGNFSVIAPRNGSLKFSHVEYEEKQVEIRGRQTLNVQLKTNIVELSEVTVTSKIRKKVVPEPTDIEIEGNYFHLRTRFPVPAALFGSNTRLVIQPAIYDINEKKRQLLRPMVFDGREYTITQKRMYDGDLTRDPLKPYLTTKTTPGRENDLLTYHDSISMAHPTHNYRADVLLSLENYNRILYTDSFTIARGTVNPLRMLDYSLKALPLQDTTVIPRPEMQLRDSQGEIRLTFLIGKTELDPDNPENNRQIDQLAQEIQAIANDPDAAIRQVSILGVASPDGAYEANLNLARRRAETALKQIRRQMGNDLARYVHFHSHGEVAGWDTVVHLLTADGREDLAEQVRQQIAANRQNTYRIYRKLKQQKGFDTIARWYLPRLRQVTYQYEYTIFRHLNREEVQELYRREQAKLSRYEYYLLASYADNDTLRTAYLEQALKTHGNFLYAANELAQIRIRQGQPDDRLLEPYAVAGTPAEILSNHLTALLQKGRYSDALNTLELIDKKQRDPYIEAVVLAMNGYYEEAAPVLCAGNPLNEVVFLLARKENRQALERARTLSDRNPKVLYLRAMAANRTDHVGEAMLCLEKAIELDPQLLELARIDGDVQDLLTNHTDPKTDHRTTREP